MHLKHRDFEKAQAIKVFIEEHYREHYTYEDLAQLFEISKSKLQLAFRAVINDNVYEYVTRVRVEHAKRLLKDTDQTVSEVAMSVGIDRSNLSYQFKKITGQTPAQYRNSVSGEYTSALTYPC